MKIKKSTKYKFATFIMIPLTLLAFTGINKVGAYETPSGWPSSDLEIGIMSKPGEASDVKSGGDFAFRYQYLSAGVNTGYGWVTWNSNGDFAKYYMEDSIDNGITPAFTYYNIFQSSPGKDMGEKEGVTANLTNSSTMNAYYDDVKLFMQKAGEFPNEQVVLHFEPDMWGFVEQDANGNAANVSVQVKSSGHSDVSGYPDNLSGFAQAILHLRDIYAPNVVVGYHASIWGTGEAFVYTDPADSHVVDLGNQSANYYKSLNADFDMIFGEFRDRDAGFYEEIYGNSNAWMDEGDFHRHALYFKTLSNSTNKPIVLWQIPFGDSTRSDSWGDYKDNIVEWLLDDPSQENLKTYRDSGVIAFWFGGGAEGVSGPNTLYQNLVADYYKNPISLTGTPGTNPGTIPSPTPTPGDPSCQSTFPDMPCTSVFHPYVESLYENEVVGGYSNGNFGSKDSVTRGQLSTFVKRSFNLNTTVVNSDNKFNDSIEGPHKNDILILSKLGIVSGYSDGTFRPETPVSREQVTKFMFKALEATGKSPKERTPSFNDINSDNPFRGYVGYIEREEIMSGYSNGNFGPYDSLTREQMAKVTDIARNK